MKNRIVLHIGMPKTGSSSLQKFLAHNNNILSRNNYFYPNARNNFNNLEVNEIGRWSNDGFPCFERYILHNDVEWKNAFEYFVNIVDEYIEKYNCILSYENIWWQGTEYVQYMKERYKNVQIIVYLRRQDTWIESFYSQTIKEPMAYSGNNCEYSKMNIQEYYRYILDCFDKKKKDKQNYVYYYDRLKEFENIVGKDNLFVYTYEEAKEFGLFKHFIESIGLEYIGFDTVESVNKSPSIMDTEVKRHLNLSFMSTNPIMMKEIENAYWDIVDYRYGSKECWLNADERKEILDFFEEDNRKTAQEYFDRDELFSNNIDYPQAHLEEHEVISKYISTLEEMLKKMCYKVRYPQLGEALKQRKKVGFFGAGYMAEHLINDFHYPADFIIDNDRKKSGNKIGGIKIIWAQDFSEWGNCVILITVINSETIESQLEECGLKKGIDFFKITVKGIEG